MPELPEVETIVRACGPQLAGRQICGFRALWPRSVSPTVAAVRRGVVGQTIEALTRRGKYIVFHLTRGWMLVHLRMSGRLELADGQQTLPPHTSAEWRLDDGRRLLLCDTRKFGRIIYTRRLESVTADLGPEPLAPDFTWTVLRHRLGGKRRQIKTLLLDQSVVAGLGNIYADESLFRAGLHPRRKSDELSEGEIRRLHRAIRCVLRLAIRYGGTSFDAAYLGGRMQERLMVYGRDGRPCRRCGAPITFLRVGQRGTHVCPRCQPPADARAVSVAELDS